MNRRDFLRCFNPFCESGSSTASADPELDRATRDDLFRLAMAQGVDPATLNPEQLVELLRQKAERPSQTGQ